jgi:hypothetical protein
MYEKVFKNPKLCLKSFIIILSLNLPTVPGGGGLLTQGALYGSGFSEYPGSYF